MDWVPGESIRVIRLDWIFSWETVGCLSQSGSVRVVTTHDTNVKVLLMKRLLLVAVFAFVAAICTSENASAQQPFGFGFQPFGFYQPYGAQFDTRLRTPPYFALNPPVYYGSRYTRPYGASPFAAPPHVRSPASYQSQLAPQFQSTQRRATVISNPYIIHSAAVKAAGNTVVRKGKVQTNPFIEESNYLAAKQ